MAYATAGQVREVLTPDPDNALAGSAAELADSTLNERVATAQAQVDAALSDRYTVPFTTPPRLVVDITVAIAAYLADLTYRRGKDHTSKLEPVLQRYEWALKQLDALRSGEADLPGVGTPTTGVSSRIRQPYAGQLFGPDSFGLGLDHHQRHRYYC